jgi:thymidylate synthase (FAD)
VQRIELLDHGYVELIESWGSDERIIEAARMSTGKGFTGWGTPEKPGDEKLLRFLWKNQHATPFEMAGMTIEVKAPIFVFREWHRHRTQSYNEMSARYVPLPDETTCRRWTGCCSADRRRRTSRRAERSSTRRPR